MAFFNTKPHMSLVLATFMTCFLLLLSKGMSAESVSFTFTRFPNSVKDITFRGDASVTDGVLLLTRLDSNGRPATASAGQAVFGSPIHLWEGSTGRAASFHTTFTFINRRTSPNQADGITFFLNPAGTPIYRGSNGGNLGILAPNSSNNFVAVEFDTYKNPWDPQNTPHIGIDIDSVKSVQTANWNTLNVPNGAVAQVKITYSANTEELKVTLSYPNVPGSVTSTLTYKDLDFTKLLPEWVQIGFSASTGDYIQSNRIRSWSFTSDLAFKITREDFIKEVV